MKNIYTIPIVLLITGIFLFSFTIYDKNHRTKNSTIVVDQYSDLKNSQDDRKTTTRPTPTPADNIADMSTPVKEMYNASNFGISSPSFENKMIEKIESTYKGALITSRYIKVDPFVNTLKR